MLFHPLSEAPFTGEDYPKYCFVLQEMFSLRNTLR
jgi:hypothetical protein